VWGLCYLPLFCSLRSSHSSPGIPFLFPIWNFVCQKLHQNLFLFLLGLLVSTVRLPLSVQDFIPPHPYCPDDRNYNFPLSTG
ncbi:hypothetical protein ES288_D11G219500v1, partial [Gossypium darwinii]